MRGDRGARERADCAFEGLPKDGQLRAACGNEAHNRFSQGRRLNSNLDAEKSYDRPKFELKNRTLRVRRLSFRIQGQLKQATLCHEGSAFSNLTDKALFHECQRIIYAHIKYG